MTTTITILETIEIAMRVLHESMIRKLFIAKRLHAKKICSTSNQRQIRPYMFLAYASPSIKPLCRPPPLQFRSASVSGACEARPFGSCGSKSIA